MHIEKRFYLFVLLLFTLLISSCSSNGDFLSSFDFGDKFDEVVSAMSDFSSNLCDLGQEELASLTRFLVAFLAFIVPNGLIMMIGEKHGHSWLAKSDKGFPSVVGFGISLFIAITTFIFLPASILTFIGTSYAAIVGWVFVWAPLIGGIYLWVRMRDNLGKFHWLLLAVICVGLAIVYGYGAAKFNFAIGIC
jgi:hypothetical protein